MGHCSYCLSQTLAFAVSIHCTSSKADEGANRPVPLAVGPHEEFSGSRRRASKIQSDALCKIQERTLPSHVGPISNFMCCISSGWHTNRAEIKRAQDWSSLWASETLAWSDCVFSACLPACQFSSHYQNFCLSRAPPPRPFFSSIQSVRLGKRGHCSCTCMGKMWIVEVREKHL